MSADALIPVEAAILWCVAFELALAEAIVLVVRMVF